MLRKALWAAVVEGRGSGGGQGVGREGTRGRRGASGRFVHCAMSGAVVVRGGGWGGATRTHGRGSAQELARQAWLAARPAPREAAG